MRGLTSPDERFIFDLLPLQPAEEDDLLDAGAQPAPGHQVLGPALGSQLLLVSQADHDVLGVIHQGVATVNLEHNQKGNCHQH